MLSNTTQALTREEATKQQTKGLSDLYKITQDLKNGILTMSQRKYIKHLLMKFKLEECKPAPTPMVTGTRLSREMEASDVEEVKFMERVPYRSAVGSLMYLMVCTRPDIASAIGLVSRFLENPGKLHSKAHFQVSEDNNGGWNQICQKQ